MKQEINKIKISIEVQTIKIVGETIIFFTVDFKEKKIKLGAPEGQTESYFAPLMRLQDIENHIKFMKTYTEGLAYCQKLLKLEK